MDGELLPPTRPQLGGLLEATPDAIRIWFDGTLNATPPAADGSLAAARGAASAYALQAKAANTRRAYRAAVRAWCAWCEQHGLPPLPASGPDVAAFLAGERGRKLTPATLDLRRAAIRHLHRLAGCPVPTDDACVAEALAGIRREAAGRGEQPRKKKAATAAVLRRLLAPIPDDLRGLRDKALLLVGFAGALRRSELAAIEIKDLEATERGLRLTLMQTKGSQAKAVTVPPALRRHRALPGSRVGAMARCSSDQRRTSVPKALGSDCGYKSWSSQPATARPGCANSAIGGAGGSGSCCRGGLRSERSRWS